MPVKNGYVHHRPAIRAAPQRAMSGQLIPALRPAVSRNGGKDQQDDSPGNCMHVHDLHLF
jgi:hypothetical protein